jgi:hypothetical protein
MSKNIKQEKALQVPCFLLEVHFPDVRVNSSESFNYSLCNFSRVLALHGNNS